MNLFNYSSPAFTEKVAAHTFCGANAWSNLMSWLEVDKPFQDFMQLWQEKIAPHYHQQEINSTSLPNIDNIFVEHFEQLYPAQFFLRLYQLANDDLRLWLASTINNKQQEVLYYWLKDSQADKDKAYIADTWLNALASKEASYKGAPIYASLTSEVFNLLGKLSNDSTKRLR